jgi:hypothetical protein
MAYSIEIMTMKIIARIQQSIHDYKNPSDEKLFAKAYKLYHLFASYHHLQHTRGGYEAAVKNKNDMYSRLQSIRDMDANEARTHEIKDTIEAFKKLNKIGFR